MGFKPFPTLGRALRRGFGGGGSSTVISNVWVPRGVILDAQVATDELQLQEANVLYDSSPQILTGSVFKLWHSLGYANPGLGYAESNNGIAWTRYSSGTPILTTHTRCTVLMSGATYVMFALSRATGKLDKLTSADGITWVVANAGVLQGTGATWDSDGIANTHVWIEGSTWYILYESATGGGPYKIGLASSIDSGVTWTKYAGNPVISETGSVSGPWLTIINGTYHLWVHVSSTLRLPTDIAHYTSVNRINWTRQPAGLAYPRSDRDESNVSTAGQAADPTLVEVSGTTYMYYEGMQNGAIACGRLKLVTAPYPIAQLVSTLQGVQANYKADIMYNGGMERVGGGGADIWLDWVETAGDGAIARTTTAGEFHGGTSGIAAARLTSGPTSNTQIRQDFTDAALLFSVVGDWVLTGWARGDGTHAGRVRAFAAADLLPTWSSSPVPTASATYAQFTIPFTVPAGQISFSIYLYCPTTNAGIAYFDDLVLRRA